MKRSELIRNADGSIYHLRLLPGDIARNIITVGDPDRVALVSRHFDEVTTRKHCREFVTHSGKINGKGISVISTGIGTDNIDVVLNELKALYLLPGGDALPQNLRIIRLGTSGAVRKDIPVNSLLLSRGAIGMDGLLHFYKDYHEPQELSHLLESDSTWQELPRPYLAYASESLTKDFGPLCTREGISLTAPGFYAPQGRHVNLAPKVAGFTSLLGRSELGGIPLTNIEMETAGIYGLSTLLGFEAISLSAILANRATGEFSQVPEKTIERLLLGALEIIEGLN